MALRKKKRSRITKQRRVVHHIAYKRGRTVGFQRGREDGFEQGRSNALIMKESAAPVNVVHSTLPAMDVLVITTAIIPTLEIGVIQPLSLLKQRENLQFEVKLEHEVSKELIASARTIVFVRNVEPAAYTLLEMAHELRKRTVYVIDDNFLEIHTNTPVGQYYSDPIVRETFIKFLRNAQTVKVDSPDLGHYIREKYNRNVIYFPPSVDFDWLDEQEKRDRDEGQIVIGYEGTDKEQDFTPVIPALKKILDYYGGFVRMEFYGYVPAALADHPSVKYVEGGMEYRSFLQQLNQCNWDIGLAPLADNLFNKGKTNNKVREYAACRIPGIYSNSPVYTPWVIHGETGYLVQHTEEGWYKGIKEMIENPSLRIYIRGSAEAAARHNFSLNTCVENWKQYIL